MMTTNAATTLSLHGTHVGAYRLVRPIGVGGMGEVWLAEHALLGRRAAIKLLHALISSRPEVITRFFNEARAATAIDDPGIVQIFDFGYSDHGAYIVMELLEGETLDARWRRQGRIALPDALRIMRQVAASVGAAHARGVIHRDLKPDNVFLVRDPEVQCGERAKILDFGIAKLLDGSNKAMTAALMGTPAFMSPEQCRATGQVDARADIYSLGCMLFTLLTGRPPFEGDGLAGVLLKHINEPAPMVSSRIAVPPAIDDLVARCMDKDPNRRFATGSELAAAIGLILGSTSVQPGTPNPLAGPVTMVIKTRRARPFGLGMLFAFFVAAMAATWISSGDGDATMIAEPTVDVTSKLIDAVNGSKH